MAGFEHYHRELLRFLSRQVPDRATAADIAQETFARVYAALQAGMMVQNPRALLYATARHLVADHHRRAAVRAPVEMADDGAEAGDTPAGMGPESLEPDAILSGRQRLAAIAQAVAELPPRPREAFVLYKLDGLSRAEVAEKMGIGVKTVETHLQVAMEACLRRLQALDGAVAGPPAAPTGGPPREGPCA